MAQNGYSPIQIYYSTTASAVPSAGNLASGELALNLTDGILFYKDNAGAVQTLATKAATSGTYTSITLSGGTANGVAYLNGSKVVTTGSALTFDGTNLAVGSASAIGGGVIGGQGDLSAVNGFVFKNSAAAYGNTNNFARFVNSAGSSVGGLTHPAITSLGIWGNTETIFLLGSSGATEGMRLTSTGLGIGTSSPGYKLQVYDSSATGGISLRDATYIHLFRNRGNTLDIIADTGATGGDIRFFTNGITQRAIIDSSGNLGLGVTPSAWSGIRALQLSDGAALSAVSGVNNTQLTNNSYWNSSNWIRIGADYATKYTQVSGQHQWFTAASSTAGSTISWTQALTLTANGSQLLGTTTEPTSRKTGNTYQAINSAVIEGTPYTTVSTTPVQLSRSSGVGIIAMISGYNTSGGAQGTWLVLVGNGVAIVVSSSDATATTPIFAVNTGYLTMQTTTGTLSVVAQIFTGA